MPTYSYACTQCDNRFDIVQSFSDASLTECGKCQGRLRKVFDSVGVVFKGSGFYRTDARGSNSSSPSSAGSSAGESSGSAGSSAGGSAGGAGGSGSSASPAPASSNSSSSSSSKSSGGSSTTSAAAG